MAQVVSSKPFAPESSMFLTRPHHNAFHRPDTNVGPTNVTGHVEQQAYNAFHVPGPTGPLNYDYSNNYHYDSNNNTNSNNNSNNHTSTVYLTSDDRGKQQKGLKIMDPLSNFVSPAGEFIVHSNLNVPSLGKAKKEPQNLVPHHTNSVRLHPHAIDEIRCTDTDPARTYYDPNHPTLRFDSKKVTDVVQRSNLGGWTSSSSAATVATSQSQSQQPNNPKGENKKLKNPYKIQDIFPNMQVHYKDDAERDQQANDYRFKTSIKQMYETVNWDGKLPPKLPAPTSTHEKGVPDPLLLTAHSNGNSDNEHSLSRGKPHIWQSSAGATWDRMQTRDGNFSRVPVNFVERNVRSNHMPGYASMYTGGVNHLYSDEVNEKFTPFTVLRTQQPKQPDANFKPNIPGYTGKTHHFKTTSVSHYDRNGRPCTTTAAFHRKIADVDTAKASTHSLAGDFSAIQTRVPPQNTHDYISRPTDVEINHSLDNVSHPVITQDLPSNPNYLASAKKK